MQQQQKPEDKSKDLSEEEGEILISHLEELSTKMKSLVKAGERLTAQFRIIESLMYKRMEARSGKISAAYAKTFEWILDRRVCPAEMAAEDSFIEWLISGNGPRPVMRCTKYGFQVYPPLKMPNCGLPRGQGVCYYGSGGAREPAFWLTGSAGSLPGSRSRAA